MDQVFLSIFGIIIYSFLGVELYNTHINTDDELSQLHSFQNNLDAFMTAVDMFTNDDCVGVFQLGVSYDMTIESFFYTFTFIVFLNYFIYGLFMAIIIDVFSGFIENEEEKVLKEKEQMQQKILNKIEVSYSVIEQSRESENSFI